ncbi:MAG: selenocysteine-specific translation elongation factor [Deltaproteobacteria bacterium]|nr:selenocysteine-specific translation elongation factor [Deltaproteobacteria bacterium]
MKHIVLGTAGHVDHGKTALIKVLTGIDTDRLKEEKERGITIELGFASLTLRSGRTIGIVDVPGHERFIKNMVAGAAGIDLVALVIAADEGIMPQTREHLQICSLLGIKKGVVAVTKADLVDKEWLELLNDDIRGFLEGTFLETAPVVVLSALSGSGIPEFVEAVDRVAGEIEEEADTGLFRLPVDRVFTMKGFGTVVTGTLVSGMVNAGETVQILPGGLEAKIRGIQVHNMPVTTAEAGQRTAINLQGIEKAVISRGEVVARPGTLAPSTRMDIVFNYLSSAGRELKNRVLVRFHAGTSEIIARVIFLERDEIEPGESAYAQLVFESPTVTMAGDRFVARSYSPVTTIGGGVIVDPHSVKHKRHDSGVSREFRLLCSGSPSEKTEVMIQRAGHEGISVGQLVVKTALSQERLKQILTIMLSKGRAILLDAEEFRVVSSAVYQNLRERILGAAEEYHKKFPLKEGLSKEELRTMMGRIVSLRLFTIVLKDLEKSGKITIDRENVRIAGHRVNLDGELETLRGEINRLYRGAGLTPPSIREVAEKFSDRKSKASTVTNVMLKEGELIKVNEEMYFHRDVIDKLREEYRKLLVREGKATPASFKELTGLSRKYIIPLMEYFDMAKLTIRAGDHRLLREK